MKEGRGALPGLSSLTAFQAGPETWTALLPDNTLEGREGALSLDANCRNTQKVTEEILLRLWVQHGIEINCTHNRINYKPETTENAKEKELPTFNMLSNGHKYWLAGPMWEGVCRHGGQPPTEHESCMQVESAAVPNTMTLNDLMGLQDSLVQARFMETAKARAMTAPVQATHPRTGKPQIFERERKRCGCKAKLKIQRIMLFNQENGMHAHLVTITGNHTCCSNAHLANTRPQYPTVALRLTSSWLRPFTCNSLCSKDMLAQTVKEHFKALISTMGYNTHERVRVCISPHARDMDPLILASKNHSSDGKLAGGTMYITDASFGLLQAQITQLTNGVVNVASPNSTCCGIRAGGNQDTLQTLTTKQMPSSLELDERIEDPPIPEEGATCLITPLHPPPPPLPHTHTHYTRTLPLLALASILRHRTTPPFISSQCVLHQIPYTSTLIPSRSLPPLSYPSPYSEVRSSLRPPLEVVAMRSVIKCIGSICGVHKLHCRLLCLSVPRWDERRILTLCVFVLCGSCVLAGCCKC